MKPPSNPFVGLRPFQSGESHLFFGRRGQVNDVLTKLQQHRLLAVVGRSGCGKSSLVRAGLIPALAAGFLVDDREQWRICVTQPGSSPLRNLATALWNSDVTRDLPCDELTGRIDKLSARLQAAGARAVFEHVRPSAGNDGSPLGQDENLLILVDQFEELFRFGLRAPGDASRDEAARFVTILLALAERRTLPAYVVITMRSDYLRDCDAFYGLPEAINRSLYLVPRLTREMRREIIEGPVSLFNASISSKLVERLLEDSDDECRFDGAEEEPDQLPVLQHALMRTWDHWQHASTAAGESQAVSGAGREIDETDYEAVGTLRHALSNDANATLPSGDSDLPKRLFQALTETDTKKRRIRRAALVSEITAEIGLANEQLVLELVNRFRSDGRTFLVVYTGHGSAHAPGDARIDISHESLIRRWDKLAKWVEEEAASADTYRRIAGEAQRAATGPWPLLRDRALEEAEELWERQRPNAAWGRRYCPTVDFDRAEQFLEHSRLERDRIAAEVERQRLADETRREERLAHSQKLALIQKKKVRVMRYFLAAMLVLAVAASVLYRMASVARDQQQADRVYFLAVNEARDRLQTNPQHAVLLALQALKLRTASLSDATAENIVQQGLALAGGRALARHSAEIRNVAMTSQNDFLITASADGTVRRWNLKSATPELQPELLHDEKGGALVTVAISSDDKWIAMGTERGDVKVRSFASNTTRSLRAGTYLPADDGTRHRQAISALTFVGSRSLVAGLESGAAWLWHLESPDALPTPLSPERTVRGPTARQISRIAGSPDGRWVALASAAGMMTLWDLAGAHPSAIALKPAPRITAIAMSADSRSLFIGSADGVVERWQLGPDGVVTRGERVKLPCTVLTLAVSPNGKWIAAGGLEGTTRMLTQQLVPFGDLKKPDTGRIVMAKFSPDDHWLVTVSADGPIELWDLREQSSTPAVMPVASKPLRGHDGYVTDISFSQDGRWLVTGGADATARLWNLRAPDPTDSTIRHRSHEPSIQALTISSDLRWLVAATPGGLERIDLDGSSSHRVRQPKGCDAAVTSGETQRTFSAVKLSSNRRWLAALSSCSIAQRNTLQWELELYDNGDAEAKQVARYSHVSAVDFSADSAWMIAGHTNGDVRVLELHGDEPTSRAVAASSGGSPITAVAIGGTKRHIAAISVDGTLRLWSVTGGTAKEVLSERFGKNAVAAVALSADDRRLVVGVREPQNAAIVWDLQASDPKGSCTTLAHHSKALTTVAVSPDSRMLVTASRDGTARLYDFSEGFTANASGGTAGCSPSDAGVKAVVFDGRSKQIDTVRISPDSRRLITIDSEGVGRLWNLHTRSSKYVAVSTPQQRITEALFSSDGNVIVTGSVDGTIRTVDLEVGSLSRRAREAIGRNLSRWEWCASFNPLEYEKTFSDLPEWTKDENIVCPSIGTPAFARIVSWKNSIRSWFLPAPLTTPTPTPTQAAAIR